MHMAAQVRMGAQPLNYHNSYYRGAQAVNYHTKHIIPIAGIHIANSYGCPSESAQPLNYYIFL